MHVHLLAAAIAVALLVLPAAVSAAEDQAPAESAGAPTTNAEEKTMTVKRGHPLCWIEFNCTDFDKSKAFYSAVFGWKFQAFGEGYEIFTAPAGLMGGLSSRGNPGKPATLPFLYVPDMQAALAQIEAAGGKKVFGPEAVGDAGLIAFFSDPVGVLYGLADMWMPVEYSPDPFGMTGADQPRANTIVCLELYGGDFAKTREFFEKLFGWQLGAVDPGMPQYMSFNPGSGPAGTFQSHTSDIPALAYIWVDDLPAAIEAIKANGGKLDGEPMDGGPMGVFTYFTDPSGNNMGLLSKSGSKP